jgi:hypothetical protein
MPQTKKSPPRLPNWVTTDPHNAVSDPEEMKYFIQVDHPHSDHGIFEMVKLTREEYLRLKFELARIRGFKSPTGKRLRFSKKALSAKGPADAT